MQNPEIKFDLTIAQMQSARVSRDPRFDGRFFIAVLSTGIFCRTICSARLPKEENVRYHLSAASALEAGYRPCKLCKPDSAPQSSNWLGTDATFNSAVKFLHAEPHSKLEDLADRLGITARHLYNLFKTKLGLSPSNYQKSVQLLFAKQLLQQTHLFIGDIAIAAGFNSARSLQLSMKKHFSLTPSELRRNTRLKNDNQCKNKNNVQEQTLNKRTTLFLSYRPPYKWHFLRDFLKARCLPGIDHVTENSYERVVNCNGERGEIKASHMPQKNGFSVQICVNDPRFIKPLYENLARVLDCNADWIEIEKTLVAAGVSITDDERGIRLPGAWSPFEAGIRAILGQQVSVAAAINKTKQLVELVAKTKPLIGFPQPQDITQTIVEQIGMPASRKNTLLNFAAAMCDDTMHQQISRGDMKALLAIKGIGPWTCQYLALRGLGDPDVWLEKDLAIIRQVEKYNVSAEAARPWRSYLTLVLWHDYMMTGTTQNLTANTTAKTTETRSKK